MSDLILTRVPLENPQLGLHLLRALFPNERARSRSLLYDLQIPSDLRERFEMHCMNSYFSRVSSQATCPDCSDADHTVLNKKSSSASPLHNDYFVHARLHLMSIQDGFELLFADTTIDTRSFVIDTPVLI